MKYSICLFVIIWVCFGTKLASCSIVEKTKNDSVDLINIGGSSTNLGLNHAGLNEYGFSNNNDLKFELDAGNPDINARIERPCEIYDTFCIRRFFAEHSKCKITAEPVPETLYRPQSTINVPSANLSVTLVNMAYSGIRTGKVEEFYINKETDNLVITLGFDFISANGYAYIKFYRRGREPASTADYVGTRYERMSVTLVIPQLNDLRLDKAQISTFLHVPTYSYNTYPGLVPTDPELLATYIYFATNLRTNQQEIFLTEGNFVGATFIQKNVCDFGLKIL